MNTLKLSELYELEKLVSAIIDSKSRDISIYKNFIYCNGLHSSFKYVCSDGFDIQFVLEYDLLKNLSRLHKSGDDETFAKFSITKNNKVKIKINKTTKTIPLQDVLDEYTIPLIKETISGIDISAISSISTSVIPTETFFASSIFMNIQAAGGTVTYSLVSRSGIYYREHESKSNLSINIPIRTIEKLKNIRTFDEFGSCSDDKHIFMKDDKVTAYFLLGSSKIIDMRNPKYKSLVELPSDNIITINRKIFIDNISELVLLTSKEKDGLTRCYIDWSKKLLHVRDGLTELDGINVDGVANSISIDLLRRNNLMKSMNGEYVKAYTQGRSMALFVDEKGNSVAVGMAVTPEWAKEI